MNLCEWMEAVSWGGTVDAVPSADDFGAMDPDILRAEVQLSFVGGDEDVAGRLTIRFSDWVGIVSREKRLYSPCACCVGGKGREACWLFNYGFDEVKIEDDDGEGRYFCDRLTALHIQGPQVNGDDLAQLLLDLREDLRQ